MYMLWSVVDIGARGAIATLIGLALLGGCTPKDRSGASAPPRTDVAMNVDRSEPVTSPQDATKNTGSPTTPSAWKIDWTPQPGEINLVDVTDESKITFQHTDGGSGRKYIVETVVAGLALFDFDGDGWVDIYLLNGAPLPGATMNSTPRNALYRNNGDWTFTDVTDAAGVGDEGYGLGVAAADYDNDGDQDLYINNFGPNVLYQNNGDGTFREVTQQAGVDHGQRVGAGVSFLDIEGDGDLDLYVANYVNFTFDNYKTRHIGDYEFPAGPTDYDPVADMLFRNNGDGTFTDVSDSSGVSATAAPGMGMVSGDFDDDGDTDLFIASDNAANLLFQNDGAGKFTEVGLLVGVAHDLEGGDNGNMGVDCGDYDNDGRLDLFVTTYQGELAVLYRNLGDGFFQDVSHATGIGASSYPHVKWGTTLADFDHDGDRDVYIACGHFMDNIRSIDDRTDVRVPNFLLANQGNGKFVDVSRRSGTGMTVVECSKGAGFDDLDNDGDLDIVVLNVNARPTILRNDTPPNRRSLQLLLRGTKTNRDGVGARVRVTAGGRTQVAEVHSGRGYQSHYGSILHFGLGEATQADRIEVRWLGGAVEIIDNPPNAQVLLLIEGAGCMPLRGAGSLLEGNES